MKGTPREILKLKTHIWYIQPFHIMQPETQQLHEKLLKVVFLSKGFA